MSTRPHTPPPKMQTPPPTYDHPIGPQLPTNRVLTSPRNTIIQINNVHCRNSDWTIIDKQELLTEFFDALEYTSFHSRLGTSIHVFDLDWINPNIPEYKRASSVRMTFRDYPDGRILRTLQTVLPDFDVKQPTLCFHGRLSMKIIATPAST
ncbi:hypothetical protein WOLCODRAFT_150458 [Wolfiporia cocos MD-104 SS10]|uniref:Uncharacterized protein n=1 Tax=Wolfiporia cocos (strain MD-104) TaxID=742152 RepID=A0A2H3JRM5_WOLCO|nr:hypothetical protein WOLCODRAFT_150458 [Wolfiporia cocos MD-104 SS10]